MVKVVKEEKLAESVSQIYFPFDFEQMATNVSVFLPKDIDVYSGGRQGNVWDVEFTKEDGEDRSFVVIGTQNSTNVSEFHLKDNEEEKVYANNCKEVAEWISKLVKRV